MSNDAPQLRRAGTLYHERTRGQLDEIRLLDEPIAAHYQVRERRPLSSSRRRSLRAGRARSGGFGGQTPPRANRSVRPIVVGGYAQLRAIRRTRVSNWTRPAPAGQRVAAESCEFVLPAPARSMLFGRSTECAVVLCGDELIAPKQLRLACRRGTYYVADCGQPSNGTTINARKLGANETGELCHGDVVLIGLSVFRFHIIDDS